MTTIKTEEKRKQPEEPLNTEPGIEECFENAMTIEANLLVTENKAIESSSDLLNGGRPLPLELNCEIYKCLPVPIQKKFIWAMGRGIYGAFRHKLLVKTKRLRNPRENRFIQKKKMESLSPDGLSINMLWGEEFEKFIAKLAFSISGDCRKKFYIGLSNENAPDGVAQDSYRFSISFNHCHLSSSWEEHAFEWPNDAIKPEANGIGDVVGCGLLLNPENEVSIFFTGNGILMGRQIQIHPLADCLYSTVSMVGYATMSLHTNFGDDLLAKPFKYDIEKCPGLGLD